MKPMTLGAGHFVGSNEPVKNELEVQIYFIYHFIFTPYGLIRTHK